MKKLKIKQVILAAALAVGLGVTGAAETAQAAEGAADQCEHPEGDWVYQVTLVSYDTRGNNRFTHTKYTQEIYMCGICGYIINGDIVVEEESHALVNSTGNRWECTHCDYWE